MEVMEAEKRRLSPGPTQGPAVWDGWLSRLTGSPALDVQSGPLRGQHGPQQGRQALYTCHQGHGAADHLGGAASQLPPAPHPAAPHSARCGERIPSDQSVKRPPCCRCSVAPQGLQDQVLGPRAGVEAWPDGPPLTSPSLS